MSLGLLLPAGLVALAALLLPLLLHLDRQTEPRPTVFAALRWLSPRLRPRRRFRLRELVLLVSRLLLVATVALLFARPQLSGVGAGVPWVLLAPGVDLAQARAAVSVPGAQWHWLAPGFPAVAAGSDAASALPPASRVSASLSSLLREIDATLPANTAVTVLVPAQVQGLDAQRPRVARTMQWRVVPGRTVPTAPATAPTPPLPLPPVLVVRHAADRAAALRYLRAATEAWRVASTPANDAITSKPEATNNDDAAPTPPASLTAVTIDAAPIGQAVPSGTRWLTWLAPGALPPDVRAWVESGGTLLADADARLPAAKTSVPVWRNADGETLARLSRHGRGRIVQLTRPLEPASLPVLLEPEFPQHLLRLFEGPSAPPTLAPAEALRPLPGGPAFPETPQPLDPWLVLLSAGLFVLERWLASASRRGAVP